MVRHDCSKQFDVIILGSGIAGSTLGTILAKHHARVLIIDKDTHPRFAIGEAMTSHTETVLSVLSHQYSVPELDYLSSFYKIGKNISPSARGYKRSFGFLYHQEGKEPLPQERIKWGVTHSSHLFRQEIDHYFVQVATKYGAKILSKTIVTDINIDETGVEVTVESDDKFNANYLVDASGYKSILAEKLNLRENPTRFKSNSRSIFTHMVGVKNIDDCLKITSKREKILPWYQGTIHHVFDGGWMWIIPFNNHDKSTNPICSVGLNLDIRRFPKNGLSPEQEFYSFVSRFPSIAAQLETAKPVRNWVSADRLQYSSHSCMGERFYLLSHATGFIDPIFSVGLTQSFTSISPLAALILKAIANNDFSTKQFAALAQLQQKIFDYYDNITNCTYISFKNFNLMNAWLRVWLLQHTMSIGKIIWLQLLGLLVEDHKGYKEKDLLRFTEVDYLEQINPLTEGWGNDYVQRASAEVEKVEKCLLSPDEAASNIMYLINSTSWLFKYSGLGDPSNHFMDLLKSKQFYLSFLTYSFWIKFSTEKKARPFDFKVKDYIDAIRMGIDLRKEY